jgi:hypothetical protein
MLTVQITPYTSHGEWNNTVVPLTPPRSFVHRVLSHGHNSHELPSFASRSLGMLDGNSNPRPKVVEFDTVEKGRRLHDLPVSHAYVP